MVYNAWFAKPELRTDACPIAVRGMIFTQYRIDKHDCTCWINPEQDVFIEGASPFRIYLGQEMVKDAGEPVTSLTLGHALRAAYARTRAP